MMNSQAQRLLDRVTREVTAAETRIRPHIIETPLLPAHFLSTHGEVLFKCENMQITNSFKLRGAMNKILSLDQAEKQRGVTTASTGNHGSAVAYLLNRFNLKGSVYLPENAVDSKIDVIRSYGVQVEFYGADCVDAELKARADAEKNGLTYISPYNDLKIVAGQGTIAIEIMRQNPLIDTVICPVGGGGLVAGTAAYLKSLNQNISVIGVSPENCCHMVKSVQAGRVVSVDTKPTLADGIEGALEPGTITLDICKKFVDDYILVSEDEIREALLFIMKKHFMLVEGAGALSTAAYVKHKERFSKKNVALIVSGGKIGLEKLRKILALPAPLEMTCRRNGSPNQYSGKTG